MSELDLLLERLADDLGPLEGEPAAVSGGITNRNYRVRLGGADYVLRLPGADTDLLGIDRAAEAAAARMAARLGVGPAVGAVLEDPPCLVCRFVEGDVLTEKELRAPSRLRALAGALRSVHDSGEGLPSRFSPFRSADDYARVARERGAQVPEAVSHLERLTRSVAAALAASAPADAPCHNDLLCANVIADGDRLSLLDWEYAGMGDPWFDLGNLAVNNGLGPDDEAVLLEAYLGTAPTPGDQARLALMRYASDLREAMWGVVQGTLSEIDFDYDGYAQTHLARLRETAEDPRLETWMEDARDPAA